MSGKKKRLPQSPKMGTKTIKAKRGTRKKGLTPASVRKFQRMIYGYYKESGRDLPWRKTHDPYRILVSEVMLQQTQVSRVMGKYERFIEAFPDFQSLADAPLRAVLKEWQGLGYNRRAMALRQTAQRVMEEFHGGLPSPVEVLATFPGIGKATASAISAFAFHNPSAFIETNIRRVFIHCFFHNRNDVHDADILPLVEKTLDASNPREWYYALMDYGVMLKQKYVNPNRRSAHYQKQSPFEGSNRQVRGMILRELAHAPPITESEIAQKLQLNPERIRDNLVQLQKEGFIARKGRKFTIA